MKAIVCKMCGSHDLVKQDGVYVCQHCGTKYTAEETAKLTVDFSNVSEDHPVPVKVIDNTENLVKLGWAVLEARNDAEALEYAKRILEADPNDANGWAIKFNALLISQTFDNLHYTEIVAALEEIRTIANRADPDSSEDSTLVEEYLIRLFKNIEETCSDTIRYLDATKQDVENLYQNHLKRSGYDRAGTSNFIADRDRHFEARDAFAVQGLSILEKYATDERMQNPDYQDEIICCASALSTEAVSASNHLRLYGRTLDNKEERHDRAQRIEKQARAYQKADKEKRENAQLEESGITGNLSAEEYRVLQEKELELKKASREDNTSFLVGAACLGVLLPACGYFMISSIIKQGSLFHPFIFILCLALGICILFFGVKSYKKKESGKKDQVAALTKEIEALKDKRGVVSVSEVEERAARKKDEEKKKEDERLERIGITGNLSADEYRKLQAKEKELQNLTPTQQQSSALFGRMMVSAAVVVSTVLLALVYHHTGSNPALLIAVAVCGIGVLGYEIFLAYKSKTREKELREEIRKLQDKQNIKK